MQSDVETPNVAVTGVSPTVTERGLKSRMVQGASAAAGPASATPEAVSAAVRIVVNTRERTVVPLDL
jgi:hypothetical protein